ncbi:MAG: [FeFe] hydrogenase H-cluster maturation GTPase HydF [Ignavibacteriales bacterium]|nr:[FeFe] hydrogenase H-cluster maturation GTPase HydF [Ignavibacteriales bacterium]
MKTPSSERSRIVFVGRRNAGKSSLVNRFLGQDLSIVSDTPGTTTDPVKKAMELLPYGPVTLVDAAGVDDEGELGERRVTKTVKEIAAADLVVYVFDASQPPDNHDHRYLDYLDRIETPVLCVLNKSDLGVSDELRAFLADRSPRPVEVSCLAGEGVETLKEATIRAIPREDPRPLLGDLIGQGDAVVFVVPIDLGAPKGRLIMPQVASIRETLDEDAIAIVAKDKELRAALALLAAPPKLVVTDSQAVMRVVADVPESIPMTTFSILMARYKGELEQFVRGLRRIGELQNGDRVLIAEACSHHAQEDDIGRVKIPRWLKAFTKKSLEFSHAQGRDFPDDLSEFKLVAHCGSCTLTRREMKARLKQVEFAGVPIVNYGVLISHLHGATPRALEPFGEARRVFEEL